ncbi:MAG: hypothetical protein IPK83_22055 [Planctomycetes bacterium]|nr:hypothetical protein [Planctomycetota bacterium]
MLEATSKSNLVSVRRLFLKRGYVLIMVLGLATLVSTLGIAFIEANSTAMPSANNRKHAARAQYLAESGVELAKHYLLYPPTTVAFDDFWRGGNNIAVDASSDFTSVSVTQHATLKDRFSIQSRGVALGYDGSVKGKKAVYAEVLLPPGNIWDFRRALLGKSATLSIPAGVAITGSVHGNGALTGSGTCTGEVSACLTALWLGGGPPTAVKSLAPAVAMPSASIAFYTTYSFRGKAYTAYLYDRSSMNASDAAAVNAIDMTATNPGRVILAKSGNFRLQNDAQLNGTLLVSGGRLELENNIQIVAQEGFPAVVCTAEMRTQANDNIVNITGPVICGDVITDNGKDRIDLTVRGVAITTNSPTITGTNSTMKFIWDARRSWLYNFESAPTRQPITVLSWREN